MGRDIRPIQPTRYKKLGEGKLTPISDKSPIIVKVKIPFSVQFIVKDANGKILTDTYYSISIAGDKVKHGVTDKEGKTERYSTFKAQKVEFYFGHLDDKGTTEKPIDGETINDKITVTPIQTQRLGKHWHISEKLLPFLGVWESGILNGKNWRGLPVVNGMILKVYDDLPETPSLSKPTVGVGHLVLPKDNLIVGQRITLAQANKFLMEDLKTVEHQINVKAKVPLYQYEYDALVSIGFNAGAFGGLTPLLNDINTKDYARIPHIIITYKAKLKSKLKRRASEANIFKSGVYDATH